MRKFTFGCSILFLALGIINYVVRIANAIECDNSSLVETETGATPTMTGFDISTENLIHITTALLFVIALILLIFSFAKNINWLYYTAIGFGCIGIVLMFCETTNGTFFLSETTHLRFWYFNINVQEYFSNFSQEQYSIVVKLYKFIPFILSGIFLFINSYFKNNTHNKQN